MSARAAWRLESLGFPNVYRYEGGKVDWMANGLPFEGRESKVARIGDVLRRDVPTCGPDERVAQARERARGWDECIVVNEAGVVLGAVHRKALDGDPAATAADVMDPGPSTYRLDVGVEELADKLRDKELTHALVTTSDGELAGMFFVADAATAEHTSTRGESRRR